MITKNLLQIPINFPFSRKDLPALFDSFLSSNSKHFIFTVNPEFVVDSYSDKSFKNILGESSFNSADGVGVVLAIKYQDYYSRNRNKLLSAGLTVYDFLFKNLSKERLTGVEIVESILEYSNINHKSIFLLGGDSKKRVSERLLSILEKKYPNIIFVGASSSFSSKDLDDKRTVNYINQKLEESNVTVMDFLLVGYGHPYQEKWIHRNSDQIRTKVFIGVGGTFDFLSGLKPRAPKFMQRLGLEWLFRLLNDPSRINRIWKAVVTFSYLIFKKVR